MVLLPPVNEVWGKIIFSQASVCPWGGLMISFPVMTTPFSWAAPPPFLDSTSLLPSWTTPPLFLDNTSPMNSTSSPKTAPTPWTAPPITVEERMIRILLECFLCSIGVAIGEPCHELTYYS